MGTTIIIEYSSAGYQVQITERMSEFDTQHRTDRVTTSPFLSTERKARQWLIKWLRIKH